MHPRSGDSFEVPTGWEVLGESEQADDLIALEPDTGAGFRANLVLTVVDNDGLDFAQWQDLTEQGLPAVLADYLLLDRGRATVAAHEGGRRLAHHAAPDGTPVTMAQWFTAAGAYGHTLTATVPDLRYAELADLFDEVAGSWRLGEARG